MSLSRKDEEKILSPEFLDEIKRVREQRGISIEEIAERINIKASYIKAIEEGDLARLPGGIYNKAYIKSVSEFLGINMKPYERSVEADEFIKDREVRIELGRPTNASIPTKSIIIGCIFVIFVLYSLFYGPRVSKKEQVNNAIENYTETQNKKAEEQMKATQDPQQQLAIQTDLQAKVGDPQNLIKQIPQVSPIQRDTQDYVGKELVITLLATAKNKVLVKDLYGRVIINKEMDPSEAAMINGSSQYYLMTDNINTLDIYLDGVQIKDVNKLQKNGTAYLLKADDMTNVAEAQPYEGVKPQNQNPNAVVPQAANIDSTKQPAASAASVTTNIVTPATAAPVTPAASPVAIKAPANTNANNPQNNAKSSGR